MLGVLEDPTGAKWPTFRDGYAASRVAAGEELGDTDPMDTVADVLARLRAEKERLSAELMGVERAIVALEQAAPAAQAMQPEPVLPPPPDPAPEPRAVRPEPIPPGPYTALYFYEAVAAYLQLEGEPKTPREIADALLAGGYLTSATNFRASARTMLRRPVSASPYGIYPSEDGERFYFRARDSSATG